MSFGQFRLSPERRELRRGDRPVPIGSRALDLLIALCERPGDLVSKDELIARAWPDTVVEETNLRVHISALRKALGKARGGARYIANVAGRGYSFVAPVETVSDRTTVPPVADSWPEGNLPVLLTQAIGREEIVAAMVAQLPRRRFMTILGPGGIGKTTVALAVANRLSEAYRDGVRFVDLSALTEPVLVPTALASVLRLAIHSDDPTPSVVGNLRPRRMLLLLDGCEHVLGAVATLAEAVLRSAPEVQILATSREPLRAEGEWQYRLPTLDLPPRAAGMSAEAALGYAAIRLFVERASASHDGFEFGDLEVSAVTEICHRLDGVPLAIELMASYVGSFGAIGLASRLDDHFQLAVRGRRTALPRQQTLSATLDWSYEFLTGVERQVLRRLAVFVGGFSMNSAVAVAGDRGIAADSVMDCIADLVSKSLISADVTGAVPVYRLLDTTRAYLQAKLGESGEAATVARRHAECMRDLFAEAEVAWDELPAADRLSRFGPQIDNLRAALDWAHAPTGDADVAIDLTVAAIPLWAQMSLVEECRRRVEQALARLPAGAPPRGRPEIKLYSALGAGLLFTRGPVPETGAAWTHALRVAEATCDDEYRLRALWGLWVYHMNNGQFGLGLELARRFQDLAVAVGTRTDVAIAERMLGVTLHYRGEQPEARRHIERMLATYVPPVRRSSSTRLLFDQRVVANVALARIMWLQGQPERAWETAQQTLTDAEALRLHVTICFALAEAVCPIAFFVGDLTAATRYVDMLLDHSAEFTLPVWQSWGRRFKGTLLLRQGDAEGGLHFLQASLDEPPDAAFQPRFTWFLGQVAECHRCLGDTGRGLAAVGEALARTAPNSDRWCLPELLRIKAELLLADGSHAEKVEAESCLLEGIAWARQQEALSWELRLATSLALYRRGQGRPAEALALLAPVHARFGEGFATADLMKAGALIETLRRET